MGSVSTYTSFSDQLYIWGQFLPILHSVISLYLGSVSTCISFSVQLLRLARVNDY